MILFNNKINDVALSSFRFCNANDPQNISDKELEALDRLSKTKNLVVQKADKGNSVVLTNRDVYVKQMENILKDNTKSENVDIKTRTLNLQVNHEKRINEVLRRLKSSSSFSNKQYKKLKQLDLDLVFCMAFVKFTKQLLMFVHLLGLHCLH